MLRTHDFCFCFCKNRPDGSHPKVDEIPNMRRYYTCSRCQKEKQSFSKSSELGRHSQFLATILFRWRVDCNRFDSISHIRHISSRHEIVGARKYSAEITSTEFLPWKKMEQNNNKKKTFSWCGLSATRSNGGFAFFFYSDSGQTRSKFQSSTRPTGGKSRSATEKIPISLSD